MSLQLVTGSANSGKTGIVYETLRAAVARGERGTLVLPSAPDVGRARSELAVDAPVGLKITTFEGYRDDLWATCGDGRSLIHAWGRRLALERLAAKRGTGELVPLAERCIRQLAEANGELWRGRDGLTTGPGRDLSLLIAGYADYLAECESLEPAEAAHLLADGNLGDPGLVVFHRFADFTTDQRALVSAAARNLEVVVSLTVRSGLGPTRAVEWLTNICTSHMHADDSKTVSDASSLWAFCSRIFSDDSTELERSSDVRLCGAEGEEAQAIAIADEIVRALDDGVVSSLDRVAVAFRAIAPHEAALRAALGDAGLPASFDVARPLRATRLGGAVLEALDFAAHGSRASLLAFVRSSYSGVERSEGAAAEARLRSLGLTEPEALLRSLRPAPGSVIGKLERLRRRGTGALGPEGLVAVAELITCAYAAGNRGRSDSSAAEDADAQRAMIRSLSLTAGSDAAECSLTELVRGLAETTVSPGAREAEGHVQVMPLTRLRARRFDVVVIGGLNAGEIPALPDESILPGSAAHEVLAAHGGTTVAAQGVEFERLLFYEAVSRARQRLVLVARVTDDDGEAALASTFLEAAFDCFEDQRRDSEEADRFDRIYRASDAPEAAEGRARARVRRDALDGAVGERFAAARRRAAARTTGLSDSPISPEGPVSASSIEAYLRCPYRWYLERVIRPKTLERGFDARDEGDYSHKLLARTYERLIAERQVPLGAPGIAAAHEVLDQERDRLDAEIGASADVAATVGRKKAFGWARDIVVEDAYGESTFVPRHTEWAFGGSDSPVLVRGLHLVGRIDRIDVDDQGRAAVVDYKRTLGAEHGLKRMLSEGRIQIPLYLAVVREVLGVEPAAGVYRGLSVPGQRGVVLAGAEIGGRVTGTDVATAAEIDELIAASLDLAVDAVAGMRSGAIEPAPVNDRVCAGCPAAVVCRAAR